MSSRANTLVRTVLLPVILTLTVIVFISIAYASLRDWSYGKIEPWVATFTLTDIASGEQPIRMDVKFDYGYGFIAPHVQSLRLTRENDSQTVVLSASGWKPLQRIQLVSPDLDSFAVQNWSLMRAACEYRHTAEDSTGDQEEVVLQINLNECEAGHDG